MKKEIEIRFRVDEQQKSIIMQKAKEHNMKLSEYVRYASLGDVEIKITTEVKEK